jgi:hypothetical protein
MGHLHLVSSDRQVVSRHRLFWGKHAQRDKNHAYTCPDEQARQIHSIEQGQKEIEQEPVTSIDHNAEHDRSPDG